MAHSNDNVSLEVKSLTIGNKTKIRSMKICKMNSPSLQSTWSPVGVAKVHKNVFDGCPAFRRIRWGIGKPTYKIAKLFVAIAKELTPHEQSVKGSYGFAKEILQQNSYCFTASLNITLLFSNISLDEAMNTCLNESFDEKSCFKFWSCQFWETSTACYERVIFHFW